MAFYKVTFGSGAAVNESVFLQVVKKDHGDGVQLSDGWCIYSSCSKEALEEDLKAADLGSVAIHPLEPKKALNDETLSQDAKSFIEKNLEKNAA